MPPEATLAMSHLSTDSRDAFEAALECQTQVQLQDQEPPASAVVASCVCGAGHVSTWTCTGGLPLDSDLQFDPFHPYVPQMSAWSNWAPTSAERCALDANNELKATGCQGYLAVSSFFVGVLIIGALLPH